MTTRRDNAGETRPKSSPKHAGGSVGEAKAPPKGKAKGKATGEAAAGVSFHGYVFRKPALLTLALTHSSLAFESSQDGARPPGSDNEQLEFVGDAVLGMVVAEALYHRFPESREGDLTRMRASLVSSRNLAKVAQRVELGPMLRLGRGEEHSGGQNKPALLANALEAVIAAIYLDGGLGPAREFVQRQIVEPAIEGLTDVAGSDQPLSGAVGDYKSALQERLQAAGLGQPRYILTDQSGPDHQKRFRIEVRIPSATGDYLSLAEAEGTTKKQAQQEAARLAFEALAAAAAAELAGEDVSLEVSL